MSATLTPSTAASLTVPQMARRYQVATKTIRRWIKAGHVKAFRVGPRGQWRIPESELCRVTG